MQFYGLLNEGLKLNVSSNVLLLCVCFGFIFGILCKPYFRIFPLTWFDLLSGWSHLSLQGVGVTLVLLTADLSTRYGCAVLFFENQCWSGVSLYDRRSPCEGDTSRMGCTQMMMPTAMHQVPARKGPTAPGMGAFQPTWGRQKTWLKSWTAVPAPTGQRGKKAF